MLDDGPFRLPRSLAAPKLRERGLQEFHSHRFYHSDDNGDLVGGDIVWLDGRRGTIALLMPTKHDGDFAVCFWRHADGPTTMTVERLTDLRTNEGGER